MDRHNMSWIRYPSHVSPDVEDVIAAQSIISRCMHVYVALCVPLSLVTGLFNLSVFIRDRTRLKVLDRLLAGLTVTSILVTLLSLNAAGRPDYMSTTNLGCAALSFFSNICYFTAQYLQVAMLVPSFLPVSSGYQLLMRPVASLAAIGGCAVCSSLIVVSMLGTSGALHATTMCQVDPLAAWPEYEIVKFSLGFALALSFQMVLFLLHATQPACRAAPDTTDSDTDSDSERWVVLAIALNMFACRLFFNAVLLHRAQLKLRQDVGSPRDELLMNLAELALSWGWPPPSLAWLQMPAASLLLVLAFAFYSSLSLLDLFPYVLPSCSAHSRTPGPRTTTTTSSAGSAPPALRIVALSIG